VENVSILHRGTPQLGTLHLTAHHLIFTKTTTQLDSRQTNSSTPKEIWIAYPIIATAYRYSPSVSSPSHIRLRNRDFSFVQFRFESDRDCRDVFESMRALAVIKGGVEKLYAFYYQPGADEKRCNGWWAYNSLKELERMGVGTHRCKGWRISNINKDYSVGSLPIYGFGSRSSGLTLCRQFSPTYPAVLAVPATISDTTLMHAKAYRSRARIPALTCV
jgi:myotubularin-related protein 6/7/8